MGLKCLFYFCSPVRKPRKAVTLDNQIQMVTKNAFQIIQNSHENIKKYLLDGGFVFNL